jgi:hypothetical protein
MHAADSHTKKYFMTFHDWKKKTVFLRSHVPIRLRRQNLIIRNIFSKLELNSKRCLNFLDELFLYIIYLVLGFTFCFAVYIWELSFRYSIPDIVLFHGLCFMIWWQFLKIGLHQKSCSQRIRKAKFLWSQCVKFSEKNYNMLSW